MTDATGSAQGDRRPASRKVADLLKSEIESGEREVGSLLPSYRKLMADHDIALNTAQAAIRLLEQDGYAERHDRKRARVAERGGPSDPDTRLRVLRDDLGDLRNEVRQAGESFAHIEQRLAAIVERLPR